MARNWDEELLAIDTAVARQIKLLFTKMMLEAATIGVSVKRTNPNKIFSFNDYPETKKSADRLLKTLHHNLETIIVDGVGSAWTLANNKNNELARRVFGDNIGKLSQAAYRRYFNNNDSARNAFIKRKEAGLALSDRVWNYTNQFKNEIELALDVNIRRGVPAAKMSTELKKFLNNPDKLFRRVRDEHGNLALSKVAAQFHPGRGVYRSSFKNAMRLARTETNMAYRASDHERWQQMDFVVGYEIKLSNNPNHCPICERLQGRYRKDFLWNGWHPQCRCKKIPILKTIDELEDEVNAIIDGKDIPKKSENSVSDFPKNFIDWYRDNKTRLDLSNSKPYWYRDNQRMIESAAVQKTAVVKTVKAEKITGGKLKYVSEKKVSQYEEKMGVTIDRTIFHYLQEETKFHSKGKSAYYTMLDNRVNIPYRDRGLRSKWEAESVVYHEFGHAVDIQNGLHRKEDVRTLMDKYRKLYSEDGNKKYREFEKKAKEFVREGYKQKNHDIIEQATSVLDTIMSLNPYYGSGHSFSYFTIAWNKELEFIAHAFENKFIGNDVFKSIMPDLYQDMIDLIDKLLKEVEKQVGDIK